MGFGQAEEGEWRNRKGALGALLTAQQRPTGLMKRLKGLYFSLKSTGSMVKRGDCAECGIEMLCLLYLCPLALPKGNSKVLHLFSDPGNSHSSLIFISKTLALFGHCSEFS